MPPSSLRTVVVDDEQLAREELCFLLQQVGGVEVIGEAANGIEALRVIGEEQPDLVMLDVQMPGITGFEVARRALQDGVDSQLVFVTAFDQYAIDAFEVNAVDYLLKPVEQERLATAVERVRKRLAADRTAQGAPAGEDLDRLLQRLSERTSRREQLAVKVDDRFLLVHTDEVVHVSMENEEIRVVTNSLSGTSNYRTLDELQARLDPAVFWRVHRSHLVNINRIKEIVPWFSRNYILKMKDGKGTEIPVSRSQTRRLREYLKAMSTEENTYDAFHPTRAGAVPGSGRFRQSARPIPSSRARSPRPPSPRRRRRTRPRARELVRVAESSRRGADRLVQDARVGRGLRDADRHVRLPGRARRRPEHGADAPGSGPAHRQQARVQARRSARRRHRDALLPAEAREIVREADHRRGRRPGAHRRRAGLSQRRSARRQFRAAGVSQPRRLGPSSDSRRLLLRDGRSPEQQLRQPALGIRAEEVHHRESAAALVADGPRPRILNAEPGVPPTPLRYRAVSGVLLRVLLLNIGVALAKLVLGYATGAVSVVSDGFHSLTDGASNVLGLVGLRASRMPPDDDHPYGHRKYETLAAAGIFIFLLLAVLEIGRSTLKSLANPTPPQVTPVSFGVMIATLLVNLWVVRYEAGEGRRLNSELLLADSMHTRSDVFDDDRRPGVLDGGLDGVSVAGSHRRRGDCGSDCLHGLSDCARDLTHPVGPRGHRRRGRAQGGHERPRGPGLPPDSIARVVRSRVHRPARLAAGRDDADAGAPNCRMS